MPITALDTRGVEELLCNGAAIHAGTRKSEIMASKFDIRLNLLHLLDVRFFPLKHECLPPNATESQGDGVKYGRTVVVANVGMRYSRILCM